MNNLRPYQIDYIDANLHHYRHGRNRLLNVMATGGGKTWTFSHFPGELRLNSDIRRKRTFVLNHRDELCSQTAAAMARANPGCKVGIEKAEQTAGDAEIVVMSVQSVGTGSGAARLAQFHPDHTKLVIPDEAHLFTAPALRAILNHFRMFKGGVNDSPALLAGFTATTNRTDGVGLEMLFDHIAYDKWTLKPMVDAGWLAGAVAYRYTTDVDLSNVRKGSSGDFNTKGLGEAINTVQRNDLILRKYKEFPAYPTIGFSPTVQHAHDMAELFNANGITATAVDAKTPAKERAGIFADFKAGNLQVIWNVDIACLDAQTEILTTDGWKTYLTIRPTDLVANWSDDGVYFTQPTAIDVRKPSLNEDMIGCVGRTRDLSVTGNHRIYYKTNPVRGAKCHVKTASDLIGKRIEIPVSGVADPLKGVSCDTSPAPPAGKRLRRLMTIQRYEDRIRSLYRDDYAIEMEILRRHAKFTHKMPSDLSLDECKFIGFFIGDGSQYKKTNGGIGFTIIQSQRYPKIIQWVDALIGRLGYDVTRTSKPAPGPPVKITGTKAIHGAVLWHLCRGTGGRDQARNGLSHIERFINKSPIDSGFLWELNEQQFDSFIEGFWLADGLHGDGTHAWKTKAVRLHNTDITMMNTIQAVASCRGYGSTFRVSKNGPLATKPIGILKLTKKRFMNVILKRQRSCSTEDTVWCVSVPSKAIITRRNGRVCVLGNSTGTDLPMATIGIFARPTMSQLWYQQAAGRLFRPYPAPEANGTHSGYRKREAILLDFVDNSAKHRLITAPTLFGLPGSFNAKGRKLNEAAEEAEQLRLGMKGRLPIREFSSIEELQAAATKIDLWDTPEVPDEAKRLSKFVWVPVTDTVCALYLASSSTVVEVSTNLLGQREIHLVQSGARRLHGVYSSPRDAFDAVDAMVSASDRILIERARGARWRREPPSNPQLWKLYWAEPSLRQQFPKGADFLRHAQTQYSAGDRKFTKGGVSQMIDAITVAK